MLDVDMKTYRLYYLTPLRHYIYNNKRPTIEKPPILFHSVEDVVKSERYQRVVLTHPPEED